MIHTALLLNWVWVWKGAATYRSRKQWEEGEPRGAMGGYNLGASGAPFRGINRAGPGGAVTVIVSTVVAEAGMTPATTRANA